MVVVENLSHRYDDRDALLSVSLTAQTGRILGLLGPNGSGKTTLFRILSTLLPPTAGRVTIDGLDLATDRQAIRQRIAVVFQSPSLDVQLTAAENLRHHGHLYGLRGTALAGRIEQLLRSVGLHDRRDDRVARFSGGMRRKVEIAKALLTSPRVLLLDEPSTGLDPAARDDLMRMLQQVKSTGVAVLLTTHLMEEADRCDQIVIFDGGRVVAADSPQALRAALGATVVTIQTAEPDALVQHLREQMRIDARVVNGAVHFESADGPALVARLAESFPHPLGGIFIGSPSLHDVFLHLTGRSFDAGEA